MKIVLNDYQKILAQVQKTIQQTEKNIVQTLNRQKVLMSWQIGKIIDDHLLKNKRAEYGKSLLSQLAKDILIKERVLYQMRSFYKAYPTLPKSENDLSWSHYRSLVAVKNSEKRKYLEELTVVNNLSSDDLQQQISKSKPRLKKGTKKLALAQKLKFERGKIFTYKLTKFSDSSALFVDCGFNVFSEIKTDLKPGEEVVEGLKKGAGFSLKKSTATRQQLHTYKAFLDKVIDGDTVAVTLDLGFKIRHREILRLAKISAAEADTLQGQESTRRLKEILQNVQFLIIKTNKTDIYGRYIADIFFDETGKEKDPQKVATSGTYLNQLLLDLKLAEIF